MSDRPGAARDARARLFVALTLPEDVCAALLGWARQVLGGLEGARLLDAEALHLTLCFLGAVPLSAVGAIGEALAGVAAARDAADPPAGSPPVFSPTEVRWLPPRRPGVCALVLHDREGRGAALQAALSARLSDGGWYEPDRRGWLPHVTVARVGSGGRRPRGGEPAPPAPPELDPFPATAVTLMRSWPGSRYEPLARIAL